MTDPDEQNEDPRYQIEDLVKGLLWAFPNVRYIAINASITLLNASTWRNEWYAVGFSDPPYLCDISGYPTWVKSLDIKNEGDEQAEFFTHFNSDFWYYKDQPLQISRNEFMDEEDLCFYVADSGEVMQFKDENHVVRNEKDPAYIEDIVENMFKKNI